MSHLDLWKAAENIAGNTSLEQKKDILQLKARLQTGFSGPIIQNVKIREVSVYNKPVEPTKKEAKVVCELVTMEGMLPAAAGCYVLLVTTV